MIYFLCLREVSNNSPSDFWRPLNPLRGGARIRELIRQTLIENLGKIVSGGLSWVPETIYERDLRRHK